MDNKSHPKKKSLRPDIVIKSRWSNKLNKKIRLVEVTWIDAVSVSGDEWAEPEEAEEQTPAKTLSVGYLWVDNENYITLVSLVNEIHLGYGITIPRGMITEIRDLI